VGDKQVKKLSGGMRRRVRDRPRLVHEPRLFFLDEPTTASIPYPASPSGRCCRKVKAQRDLTVLITTHYMDEADKLCDRIAIVDHGELKALDSPLKLKASIPGKNVIEVSFSGEPPDWREVLEHLPDVERVTSPGSCVSNLNGKRTSDDDCVDGCGGLRSCPGSVVIVQSTTLDECSSTMAGRALRDALQDASPQDSPFMMRRG